MPKIPKGIFKREGRGYYCRIHSGGRERWVALGANLSQAVRRFHQVKLAPNLPHRITVAKLAREWMKTYVLTAREPYSQGQTESRVNRFLVEFLGSIQVPRLSPEDLRRYRLWLEGKGLKPTTVKHVLSDARCLLNWAEDAGFIDRSPFPKRLMPRLQERPPDRLTDTELEAVSGIPDPYGFVVRLAAGTGLRWGELTRAESRDVEGGVILVHHTKSTKMRRVPLSAELQEELRTRIGKLVPYSSPGQFNTRVRILSQVWRFHVHQLRHTFACRWLEAGGSLAGLQQILGHSTIVTTQRYGRIADDLVRAEAARVYALQKSVATTVASENGQSGNSL